MQVCVLRRSQSVLRGRRRLLTCAGLQASVEQAAADISSILASEKKKKTKKVDANKMAALALIFNPVRCACRSPAARRRFFSPSSPCLGPDAGGHGVTLGREWELGPNRPARRKGHPRCAPLNALLLCLAQTRLPQLAAYSSCCGGRARALVLVCD